MERLVLRTARRHIYGKLACCTAAVGVGAALASLELTSWLGWAVIVIAGVPGLILLRGVGEDTERIVIDDAGIRDSHLPIGLIGWTEIKGATVQTIGGRKWGPGLPGVYLALRGIDVDPQQIAELISRRAREGARW